MKQLYMFRSLVCFEPSSAAHSKKMNEKLGKLFVGYREIPQVTRDILEPQLVNFLTT